MNLDRMLVLAALARGHEGWNEIVEAGVCPVIDKLPMLSKEGGRAFEFVQDYVANYGSTPPPFVVQDQFGWADAVPGPELALPFLVERLGERTRFNFAVRLQKALTEAIEKKNLDEFQDLLGSAPDDFLALGTSRKAQLAWDALDDVEREYMETKAGRGGIPLPWPSMMGVTRGGLRAGWIVGIVGRPAVGKTFAAFKVALHAAPTVGPVLIVSPESPLVECTERMLCMHLGVSYDRYTRGQLDYTSEEIFLDAIRAQRERRTLGAQAGEAAFEILPSIYVLPGDLKISPQVIEREMATGRYKLLIIDALAMCGKGRTEAERLIDAIMWSASRTKAWGAKYGTATLTTGHLSRDAVKEGASMENIGLTDAMGKYFNAVFAMEQTPEERDDRQVRMPCLKIRRGQIPAAHPRLNWDHHNMNYDEITDGAGETAPTSEALEF